MSDSKKDEKLAKKKTPSIDQEITAFSTMNRADKDNLMDETVKTCIDRLASIELKRLTIIEKEMDKVLEGHKDVVL